MRKVNNMMEYSRFSLLETILLDSGCHSLGELSALSKEQRLKIAEHIKNDIPLDAPTLQDYNEVIHYLLCMGPEDTEEDARKALFDGLK